MPRTVPKLGCAFGSKGPCKITRLRLSNAGENATYATIRMMQALVRGPEGVGNFQVRAAALEAVRGATRGLNEIEKVFAWVKKNIEFRGEYAETLQSPLVTLQLRAGDCDDHSVLVSALLQCLGMRTRFTTVAAIPGEPDTFSHVYAEVWNRTEHRWMPLDTTVKKSVAGWEPPMITRKRTFKPMGDFTLPLTASAVPTGLSPTQQMIYGLANPVVNALSSDIAHGTVPEIAVGGAASLTGGSSTIGGIPDWLVILAFGGLAFWAVRR